ncbi:MAG: DEAD/DEAH box helicase family protein [Leptolyngbya sp. BL-A-14]
MIAQTITIPQQQTIQLRDYQIAMIAGVYALIRSKCLRVLMIAVMGAGKTVIAAQIMQDAISKGRRCVFLVSLNVLLEQTARTLQSFGVHCTILQGDRPVDEAAPVIVASLQTISSRLRRGQDLGALLGCIDVIVADEAHISAFQSAYAAIDNFFPNAIKIGLTATPWRLSSKECLGQRYDKAVLGPQPPEIIKRGGAVSCRGFHLAGAIDLETLRVRGGTFVDSDIAEQACKAEALDHVIDEWLRLCPDRPTLMVGATVEQARRQCDRFNQRGIAAEVIVGSTPAHEREAIIERVRRGITKVICSVGCLTAGFDLPAISAILYVRATKSRALFQQTAGRGSRPYPGKTDYFLLDFGGNLKRFGNPMGFQDYDISQPVQDDDVQPLTKTCPGCQLEVTVFAQICPHCGHEFTGDAQPDEPQQEALVLAQLNEFADTLTRQKIKLLRQLKRQAYESDRSPDEAIAHFVSEFGHNPPGEWMRHACLTQRYSPSRKAAFVNYLFRHCNQASKWSQQWISYHLTLELGEVDLQITPWYETLGVDRNASWETVKAAYIAKAEALDPDKVAGVDLEALQQQLNLALSDAREVVK